MSLTAYEVTINDGTIVEVSFPSTLTLQQSGSGSGDVVGPSSATDNALARFDSTTGKLLQDSPVTLSDAGALAGVASISMTASDSTTRVLTIQLNQSGQYTLRIT